MATSNNEWLHIYNNNLVGQPQPNVLQWSDDVVTEATTITTTTTTMASSSVSNQLGRVARPTNMRRRSRVSRRTPTTLLNTDTTNFRAMVQQFTGGGGGGGGGSTFMTAPAAVAPRQTLSSWNTNSAGLDYYGTGSRISQVGGDGYNAEFRQPQDQQYYTMVADNGGDGGGGGGGGDHQHGFVQRVQEGGTFSSDNYNNNNIGKNTANMF